MIKKFFGKFQYNAPVILTFTLIAFFALLLDMLTNGWANDKIFSVGFVGWLNPMQYVRLFTHIIGHSGYDHFINNFTMILLVGPMLEEKYGSKTLLKMILVTAFVTGLMEVIFFPHTFLRGASGIVFMLILLSSFTNLQKGRIPITLILVAIIYLSGEIANAVFKQDNISQMAHIIGGFCGCIFGWAITKPARAAESSSSDSVI